MKGLKTNVVVEYPTVSLKGKYTCSSYGKGKATVKVDSTDTSKSSATLEASTELQPNLFLGGEVKYSSVKGLTQLTMKTGNNFDSVNVQLYKKYSSSGEV